MTSTEYKEQLSAALRKIGGTLPLGFEYTRLTGQNAPIGGVDYMGQTATRAMYADLWAWLNEHKPDAIVSESEWQSLYASQNGNVAKFSSGDGSTTFRFPRVVGYFKGAGSTDELGQYIKEGLPGHTHTRGSMNITGFFGASIPDYHSNTAEGAFVGGARPAGYNGAVYRSGNANSSSPIYGYDLNASLGWTGETSQPTNPIYGNSDHVTPETVTVVMGVIAFGSVASIGEATEEGIVAELGEHGAKLGELGSQVYELEGSVANAVPAGFVMPFAANSDPEGYLLCNGAAVSRTTYAALFSAIGTTYGAGDGSTTFNLPNLTDGRFIRGEGIAGSYYDAGLPEIKGTLWGAIRKYAVSSSGSFVFRDPGGSTNTTDNEGDNVAKGVVDFFASRSSTLYGRHATVMPDALSMRYYIKY